MQIAVWFALSLSKLVYSGTSQIERPVREYFLWSGGNERLPKTKLNKKKTKKVVQSFLRQLSLTFSMIPTSCRMNLYVKSRVFFMKSIILRKKFRAMCPSILHVYLCSLLFLQISYATWEPIREPASV